MSVTPPQSPSKFLSTVDHSDTSDQPSKDDGTSIVEADPDENLNIETDPLADNLDYEAEELDEQEDITNGGKSSPVNQKNNSFQECDSYDRDVKEGIQSSCDVSRDSCEGNSSETSATKIENGEGIKENIEDESNVLDNKQYDVSNSNEGIGNGTAVDRTLGTNDDAINDQEAKEDGSATKTNEDIESKSIENVSNEELEEGEVSDEDEEARKERLKPQPVCRFYSKGACTWGASCRFIHPGVMDTGRYSMFAQPKPILPGVEDEELSTAADENSPVKTLGEVAGSEETIKSPAAIGIKMGGPGGNGTLAQPGGIRLQMAAIPKIETAWERGLRQAKEMKKRSQQRKETDVEYEEKRTNMSLTQAELDKENDYYMRQASPLHDPDDGTFGDDLEDIVAPEISEAFKGRRRVAPPPPEDFRHIEASALHGPVRRYPPLEPPIERSGRDRELRDRNYSSSPPPKLRRAPPRSPPDMHEDIDSGAYPIGPMTGRTTNTRPDEWADPWMRGRGMGMNHTAGRGGQRQTRDNVTSSMATRPLPSRNGRNDSLQSPASAMDDGRPQRGGRTSARRRSYSSGSSHSSSSNERARIPGAPRLRSRSKNQQGRRARREKGERRRHSSGSSRSSGSAPSPHHRRNARSSSPEYIARRQGGSDIKRERNRSKSPNSVIDPSSVRIKSEHGTRGAADGLIGSKSQATLQKRLGAMAAGTSLGPSPSGFVRNIKKEPEDKGPGVVRSGGNANLIPIGPRPTPSPHKQTSSNKRRNTTRSRSAGSSRSSSGDDKRSPSNRRGRRRSSGRRSRSPRGREIKKEPGGRHSNSGGSFINKPAVPPTVSTSKSVRDPKHSTTKTSQPPLPKSPPKEKQGPFKLSFTKSSSGTTKPANRTVLEKLGAPVVDRPASSGIQSQTDLTIPKSIGDAKKIDVPHSSSSKTTKRKASEPIEGAPSKSEKTLKKSSENISKSESKSTDKKAEVKKEKKSAADRREELMKQLKAVENAIAKKRVKIDN